MSNTYLDWAKNNFELNKLIGKHEFIRADCMEWLNQQVKKTDRKLFDLIFLDPPTFSNSSRMEDHFDIQRDYIDIINNALTLLTKNGRLYFSTNFKKFKLDKHLFSNAVIQDISPSTIPEDFARNKKIHYCWEIQKI